MPELNLTEENLLSRAGVSDREFADHSGDIQQGYQLGSVTEGLVAYYPMDEGQGQVLHDGALDNLGQINGASWNGSGQVGSDALNFDGADDGVDISYLPNDIPLSVSVWAKKDNTNSSQDIFQYGSNFWGVSYETKGSSGYEFNVYTGSSSVTVTSGVTTTGSWVHITATVDSNGNVRLYIDGILQETGSISGIGDNDGVSSIGFNASNDGNYFGGLVDDARVYNRALSQPEIEALYNLTQPSGSLVEERDLPTYPDDEVVARYEFEGDVTDSWGDNDGTDNTSAGYVDGVYGQSKDFDGTDDYVDCGDVNSFHAEPSLTVSAWTYLPDKTSDHAVAAKYESTSDANREWFLVYEDLDDRITFSLYDGSGGASQGEFTNPTVGRWTHLVGTYDGDTALLYIDGVLEDSASVGFSVNETTYPLTIGALANGVYYHSGSIDDVRIYDRALDPIEVERLYNLGAYRINRGEL